MGPVKRRAVVPISLLFCAACLLFNDPLDQDGLQMRMIPHDTALYVGASLRATGKMINSYGDTYPSDHIHYRGVGSSASVLPFGKVTGLTFGRTRIIATREQFTDTGFVSVVPRGTLALSSYANVVITNVDGSGFESVASAGQGLGEAAAWVPGRDSVVYPYGIPGGAGAADLYVGDLQGNHRLLAAGGRDPRVTADRNWVYFTGSDVIERIHLDGTGREIVIPTTVAYADPSPDGTRLVYMHLQIPPGSLEIRVRTLADSTERLLTDFGLRPRWSPDGSQIAFWRGDLVTNFGAIYVFDTTGSNLHQLSPPGRLYGADVLDWSPDGLWLLARGQEALELIQVSTGLSLPLGYTADYLAGSWRR